MSPHFDPSASDNVTVARRKGAGRHRSKQKARILARGRLGLRRGYAANPRTGQCVRGDEVAISRAAARRKLRCALLRAAEPPRRLMRRAQTNISRGAGGSRATCVKILGAARASPASRQEFRLAATGLRAPPQERPGAKKKFRNRKSYCGGYGRGRYYGCPCETRPAAD